jgi:hypothetical protein
MNSSAEALLFHMQTDATLQSHLSETWQLDAHTLLLLLLRRACHCGSCRIAAPRCCMCWLLLLLPAAKQDGRHFKHLLHGLWCSSTLV